MSETNTSHFFNARRKLNDAAAAYAPKWDQKSVSVEVGDDCGFRATAAAMIDNVLINPHVNEELAKQLIELHARYFQQQCLEDPRTSAKCLVGILEDRFTRIKFFNELVFALRQRAVDELCAHPECYRGAFLPNSQDEGTAPAIMRLQTTWIDESAIAALAKAMNISIVVHMVMPGKELPLKLTYNPALDAPSGGSIGLQLHNKHYTPLVSKPEYYEVLSQIIDVRNSVIAPPAADPELATLLDRIAFEDKRLLEEFEKTSHRLEIMVEVGEITKDDLLAIYIQSIQHSEYLQGRIKYVGIEHGHQHFFEALEYARQEKKIIHASGASYDKQVTQELVHAIARAVSLGQLNPEILYSERISTSLGF